MKILITILLLITTSLLLLSCQETVRTPQASKASTDITTTSASQTTASHSDFCPMSGPSQAFYDYDEYLNWLDSADYLPETFIPYETLSFIGAFDGVVCLSNTNFMYNFIDANGVDVNLYIYLNIDIVPPFERPVVAVLEPINLTDMRFYPNEASGVMYVGDWEYYYVNGKLCSIWWQNGTTQFILGGQLSSGDQSTKYEHETFVSKMLTKSKIQNVLNTLPNSLYPKSAK